MPATVGRWSGEGVRGSVQRDGREEQRETEHPERGVATATKEGRKYGECEV